MPSSWGPRIFWLVVFVLAGLGVYALFSDPAGEMGKIGFSAPLASMVSIGSNVAACDLQFGPASDSEGPWQGEVKLARGKILQLYSRQADPASVFSSTRFECSPLLRDGKPLPIILHVVYQTEADDTLTISLNKKSQKIPLPSLPANQQFLEVLDGTAKVRAQPPMQFFENDSATDDHHPCFFHDAQGRAFLLYMNSERSKGLDLQPLMSGSFESLETPILGSTLRLSQFRDGAWQYSEAVTSKLDSCLDPVAAIDPTGRMFVAWVQKSLEGWDIYYQSKDFGTQGDSGLSWNKPVKLTTRPGYYQQLVAATDAKGKVWLAWQSWRQAYCDIEAAVLNDETHFMKTPGPVTEHPADIDGRWFPALATDKLGNTYLAWSVMRQGHFDIEVMKLYENMVKSKPLIIASSLNDAMRPSLACDPENHLWVAYEESEPVRNYGDLRLPASRIRVRTLRSDGSLDEWPALKVTGVPRCSHPRMMISPRGLPLVAWHSQQKLYGAQWSNSAWTEPKELSTLSPDVQVSHDALYQPAYLIDCHEALDAKGRMRLLVAMQSMPDDAPAIPKKPAPAATFPEQNPWKPFAELAHQFRKRSDDLVLNKRYLLRGLVVLPSAVQQVITDPWSMTSIAQEQGLYDWVVVPHQPQAPVIQQWQTAQRTHLMTQQGDRSLLVGYYRPQQGQREPLLVIDSKKDEMPLPPLAQLEAARRSADSAVKISVTEAADRDLMTQFLSQRQRLGFSLTTDWRMLPMLTQPNSGEAYNESLERLLLPFWYPEITPALPPRPGLRVVAYATGKSYDHLLDALRARHFYIATDDIYLTVRCERKLPGDVFQTSFRPAINVTVQGTSKLKSVEVWLDNKLVKSEEPPGQAALLEYIYDKGDRQWHNYVVRVTQENGAEAIAQPFWIRYLP